MSRIDDLIEEHCPDGVEFWPLERIFTLRNGYTPSKSDASYWDDGTIPWFRMEDIRINGRILDDSLQKITPSAVKGGRLFPADSLLVATSATIGEHALITVPHLSNQRFTSLTLRKEWQGKIYMMFAFYYGFRLSSWCQANVTTSSFSSVDMAGFRKIRFPVPPMEVQREIVRILDTFSALEAELEAELEARRKQYGHYRRELLTFDNTVRFEPLGDVCVSIGAGGDLPDNFRKGQSAPTPEFPYPIYSNGSEDKSLYGFADSYRIDGEVVTVSARGTIGFHTVRRGRFTPIVRLITLQPNSDVLSVDFLNYALDVTEIGHSGGSIPQLTVPAIKLIRVPVPPLAEQQRIVGILDNFDALVNDLSVGLPAELAARRKQYEHYRDRLLTFEERA